MATVMSSTPARQPFGILSETKLRNLQSVKNRQNAITPNSAPSLKRRAPSPDLSDSENVDPGLLDSFGKRKRAAFDDDVSLSKPSRYNLHVVPTPVKPQVQPRLSSVTPRIETSQKTAPTPLSAPAAAGRSPIRGKRMGVLRPGKHFASPSFGASPKLSIAAALKGTLAHKKSKKLRVVEDPTPKSWVFDIFEETEEQQDYKMNEWTMTQSATILDISDDESKAQEKSDRGKENVDPDEVTAPVTRSMAAAARVVSSRVTRKDMMTDEPRSPLGDLNPSEFYGEGLDATSVVLVHDETSPVEEDHKPTPVAEVVVEANEKADFTFESTEKLPEHAESLVVPEEIGDFLVSAEPCWPVLQTEPDLMDAISSSTFDDGAIEIWESESAKDETEKEEVKFDDGCGFALQDL